MKDGTAKSITSAQQICKNILSADTELKAIAYIRKAKKGRNLKMQCLINY
jgi:hypothetical protein